MASLLKPAPAAPAVALVSLEEYHRQPEFNANGRRTELIRGVVIEKMGRSPLHATLVRYLFDLVRAAVADLAGLLVLKEDPLTFIDSEPEPDVSVVTGSSGNYRHAHPTGALLVIEVSVSSLPLDRRKAAIYAEAGILEYWIVLAEKEAVEVHTAPQDGQYTARRVYTVADAELTSAALPALRVDLGALFDTR